MDFILQPWQLYLVILAGWMNRQQQEVIAYLLTENRVLKASGRKRFTRRHPACRGGLAAFALLSVE